LEVNLGGLENASRYLGWQFGRGGRSDLFIRVLTVEMSIAVANSVAATAPAKKDVDQ